MARRRHASTVEWLGYEGHGAAAGVGKSDLPRPEQRAHGERHGRQARRGTAGSGRFSRSRDRAVSGDVAVVAFGALSGLGRGGDAVIVGNVGDEARVATTRGRRARAAGLSRPFCARGCICRASPVAIAPRRSSSRPRGRSPGPGRARCPSWRERRVGLALAYVERRHAQRRASLSGAPRPDSRCRPSWAGRPRTSRRWSTPVAARTLRVEPGVAGAHGVLGVDHRDRAGPGWLDRDACDLVLAGGFDAVERLRRRAASRPCARRPRACRRGPSRLERDGMALGEGAAVLALVRAVRGARRALGLRSRASARRATRCT